jgi:capsid protein
MLIASLLGLMMLTAADSLTSIDTHNVDHGGVTASASYVAPGGNRGGGYDAINPRGRRQSGPSTITREDNLLRTGRRTKLSSTSQDLVRNFTLAGWMIRRHLDYVALFDFHSRNANAKHLKADKVVLRDLDAEISRLMKEDSKPEQMDIGGRFGREKMFRIAEMRRTVDGDMGLLKIQSGHLQGIESDLIRNPTDQDLRGASFRGNGKPTEWVEGVKIGTAGKAQSFAIHRRGRGGSSYELQNIVPATNLIHYGHFSRFASDQVRGISPVVAGLNNMRDVYEGIDLSLAKMKVSQLFAFAVFSEALQHTGDIEEEDATEDGEGKKYNVDFGSGPVHLELDPGDRAEFLESKTPSTELQAFCQLVIGIGIKALDIPYSFYDESFTNFFGSRAAWSHYERSCIDKRTDQVTMRDDFTRWKLQTWIKSGRLTLPLGMTIADLEWEWVPRGIPWWDPSKEIRGDKEAISAGFDNPESVCKSRGTGDVYDNIRTTCRVIAATKQIAMEELGDENAFKLDYAVYPDTEKTMSAVEAIQKVYLGVGKVITEDEARQILNDTAGTKLPMGVTFASKQ